MKRLVVASHNLHKIREIKDLLAPLNYEVVGLPDVGDFPPIIEDGDTFQENARKKAVEIARCIGEPVLADDSGLEVYALEGAPGVLSARYAGEPSDDRRNNALLLEKLKDIPDEERGAQFRCVIALAFSDGSVEFAEGVCQGTIAHAPKGDGGFGYDPLFLVPQYGMTFAELAPEVKNRISHRFLAVQRMLNILAQMDV